jgi:hypothetical protein
MNTCKTCKWHEPKADDWGKKKENGAFCTCPKIYEEMRGPHSKDEYLDDHFVYSYYESGSFWTGNNFGCVHHETRPQA